MSGHEMRGRLIIASNELPFQCFPFAIDKMGACLFCWFYINLTQAF